jgi:hypothetical protein
MHKLGIHKDEFKAEPSSDCHGCIYEYDCPFFLNIIDCESDNSPNYMRFEECPGTQ